MRWLKRDIWEAGIAIAGLLFFLILTSWLPATSVDARERILGPTPTATMQATPTVDATLTALNKEKLGQDIEQGQHTVDNFYWNFLPSFPALVTAILGFFIAYSTFVFNSIKERHDREEALEKRAEELFKSVVENLGNESAATKVGAVIQLRSFLDKSYTQFHKQVFALAVANLRLRNHDPNKPEPLDSLSQELIVVFKESFLLTRDKLSEQDYWLLDHIQLDCAYLAQADLKGIRMRYASLRSADFSGADLSNADLMGADLTGANIGEAQSLRGTDLRGVKGLRQEQLIDLKTNKDAIIDGDITATQPQPTATPPAPAQSSDVQASPASPAQANTPPPSTDAQR